MKPRLNLSGLIILIFSLLTVFIFLILQNENQEFKMRETGVDKQLRGWFQARAYPDPYFLNEKFTAAWEHAKAMRNDERIKREAVQNRITSGNWSSLNGPQVGRVLSIAINPSNSSNLFIGTASGGIWKTTDAGNSWTFVPTNQPVLGVPAIAFHPSNSNIILAGTGEVYRVDTSNIGFNVWKARGTYGVGIIRSTDGGVTWTQVFNKNMSELFGIQMIKFDPSNANNVFACTTHGLYKSTDGGATWNSTPVLNKIYVSDVVINSSNSNQMMAAVGNLVNSDKGIYRTMDGGSNWTKIASAAIPTTFYGFSRFAYRSGNTVYISMGRSDGGAGQNELFRSTDFGANWTSLANSHHCQYQYWFSNVATILPSNSDSLFIAGVSLYGYRVSTTSRTSIGAGVHSDYHDIQFDPTNNNIAYIATDGGMYKTTNARAASPTFTLINTGLNISQFYASIGVSATIANNFVGGLQDNGVWIYDGSSWTKKFAGDGGPCVIDPSNDNNVYASNDARLVNKSTTGINGTYSAILSSWAITGDDRTGFMTPLAISKSNPATLYVASDNLHKSTNNGSSWTNNDPTISNNTNYIEAQYKTAISLAVSSTNENKVYVSLSPFSQRTDDALNVTGQPSVFKTINGGTSFTDITSGLPQRFVMDFAVSKTNDDSVFVALGGFGTSHIYVTGNGGSTWTNRGTGLPDVPFNAIVFDPLNANIIYAGCDLGIYVSPDRGATWYDFNSGIADTDPVMIFDLQITSNNKLLAATHGSGAFIGDLLNLSTLPVTITGFTGVNEKEKNKLQWTVEQESEIKHYEIEKSINGGTYRKIGTVNALNQTSTFNYQYFDIIDETETANYYYRLKVVNMDGSSVYSSTVAIKIIGKSNLAVLNNPFENYIRFKVTLKQKESFTVMLYDAGGKMVKQSIFSGQPGTNLFTIYNTDILIPGVYLMETTFSNNRYSIKLIRK